MVGEGIEVVAEGEAFSILLIYLGTPMEKMETMVDSHSKILALRPG